MTQPRQFLPDTTYQVTRRCTQRQIWFKPSTLTNQIFLYCIAVAAKRSNITIHAVCVMGNHWHCIFSDPETQAAVFYAWVHKYVAKALNASLGRWENLWSSDKPNVVSLKTQEDILDKILYVLCNPVEARLIAKASKWPGVWLYRSSHSRTIERPAVYFSEEGEMPETIELVIERPSQFSDLSQEQYESCIEEELHNREMKIRTDMEAKGQSFLGVRAILQQTHGERPKSREPRRGLNPAIASKNTSLRIEEINRRKEFLAAYRKAYKKWRDGDPNVIFPAGTYALRVYAGVKCQPG